MPATLDVLREDHDEALEKSTRASRALQALGQGRPIETIRFALEDLSSFVDTLLRFHIPLEEEVLFPFLVRYSEIRDTINEMVRNNNTMRANNGRFGGELQNTRPDSGVILEAGNHVLEALNSHIRLGDLILFPLARRMLTKNQIEELETKWREKTAPPPTYPLPVIEL